MPVRGQRLLDRFTGDACEFLETGQDTAGERVTLKVTLRSKGPRVADHIHILQDETFRILSGRLTCIQNSRKKYLSAGAEILLPKNVPHNHYNSDDEPAVYIQTITPALDLDYFLENLFGMINDGIVTNGKLPFPQVLVSLKYLESPSLLANLPRGLQTKLASLLAPVARCFGYRALYKRYTGVEK